MAFRPTNTFSWDEEFPLTKASIKGTQWSEKAARKHRKMDFPGIREFIKADSRPFCLFVASSLPHGPLLTEIENGIVCASAGNHAQGVALSCKLLEIKGTIFMPSPTPNQKIEQVRMFGEDFIDIVLLGDTFDDSYHAAKSECERLNKTFIHPFND